MTALDSTDRTTVRPGAGPVFPLTDLQQGYLVGASGEIEFGGFRPSYYLELEAADFDPERASYAVDQLVARHEQLRTVVRPDGGGQQVLDAVPAVRVDVVDVSGLPPAEQESVLGATRSRMSEPGVDPLGWPLFAVAGTRLGPARVRVHLAMSLLLLDGASIRTLLEEWRRLYADPAAELPPVPTTVRDWMLSFAAHQRTSEYAEHLAYWRTRLDTLPEAPQLPLVPGPAGGRFVQRSVRLDAESWRRLRTTCQRNRVLPTAALMHLFAEAVGAWSAVPRFSLNVLHHSWATRDRASAALVGQRGATLALEVDLAAEPDFWERARRLQRQLWRDLEHADVSAVQVMREVARHRGWGPRAALPYVFTSMLAEPGQAAAPRHCRTVTSALQTPQVLIDNQVQDGLDGSVNFVWDVVDDAYPAGLPDLMFDYYRRLLRELGAPAPGSCRPGPLPPGFRERVAALNRTPGRPPTGRLEDGFLDRVSAAPDATALIAPDRTLTYRQLDNAARSVADWLRRQGVRRGDIVPLVMTKGWEQVAGALGVLLAGAAYCPIDPGVPAARIGAMLDECTAPVLLGQSHRRPDLGERPPPAVLQVDGLDPDAPPPGPTGPDPGWRPGELAYVIYTSGSTGRPKGVMIEHEAALNTVLDVNERVGLGPGDRVFGISAMSFDLSVWDVFGTLAAGGCLVLPAPTVNPDPEEWARTAAAHGVTVWNSVPALAELLAEAVEHHADRPAPLRAFLLSGDWVGAALPDRLRARWPGSRVIALGGATEAAIWSNIFEVAHVDPGWTAIPYGRPLAHQTMTVLDDRLDLRPPWAVGEICIGGAGLARGYRNDPSRTADRFVTVPSTGERLYRTGDLGRYWPDGTIEFLGRLDRQVKIGGFRVELGDVEAALRTHPDVRDCVAVAQGPAGGPRRVTALVVPVRAGAVTGGDLAGHLAGRLPRFMVPARIEVVDSLPLTANGKVDVQRVAALTVPDRAGRREDDADLPSTGRLRALWAELLELPTVEPDHDFFVLGGNSLLALRMVNRLRAEDGLELTLGQVFEARTVRALAAVLRRPDPAGGLVVRVGDGAGTPFVLFHPVGGSVVSYLPLRWLWSGPVAAIQSTGLAGGSPDEDPDLPAMVTRYAAELRRHQPAGPYLLGGWSMGGVLAHEVGRVLAADGEQVRVVMIDSEFGDHRVPGEPADRHLLFLDDLAAGRLPDAVADAVRRAPAAGLAAAARDAAVAHGLLPAELDLAGYLGLVGVHAHNLAVLAEHWPRPTTVPTLLIVAGRNPARHPAPGWRTVCPRLECTTWAGHDHYSIATEDGLARVVSVVEDWLGPPAADDRPTPAGKES